MPRVVRIALYLLLLAGLPALLSAQEPQEMDPATRFLIEKITIQGIERGSARAIVSAETRLREGEAYSEPALRQAIYRVKRLPFVLDAELSLKRGSERGAYELVITVEPTRPVFFLAQTNGTIFPADSSFARSFDDRFAYFSSASAGVRRFLGTRGLMFASVDTREGSDPTYRAGYTHYNPVGSGSYASVGIGWARHDEGGDAQSTAAEAELGLPLAANHSLRTSFYWSRFVRDFEPFGVDGIEIGSRSEDWTAEVDWIYDTTDDPFFPSQGDKVIGTARYGEGESRSETRPSQPDFFSVSSGSDVTLGLNGRRHVRLTPRQSVALGVDAYWQRQETSQAAFGVLRSWHASAEGRHSLSLWGFEKTERIGDLRLESSLSVGFSRNSLAGLDDRSSQTGATLATALVFRNAWGILRAGLYYSEDDL